MESTSSPRESLVGSGRSGQRQRITDLQSEHHCNYSQVPRLLLQDCAAGRISPPAVVLWFHYEQVTFEKHGAPVDQTLAETADATGLSQGTVMKAREELARYSWVETHKVGTRGPGSGTSVVLKRRWAENCPGHHPNGRITQNLSNSGGDTQILSKETRNPGNKAQNLSNSSSALNFSGDVLTEDPEKKGSTDAPNDDVDNTCETCDGCQRGEPHQHTDMLGLDWTIPPGRRWCSSCKRPVDVQGPGGHAVGCPERPAETHSEENSADADPRPPP